MKNKDSEKKRDDVKCKYCNKLGHTEDICHSKYCKKGIHFTKEACHKKLKITREKGEEKKREIQQEPDKEELNNVYKIQQGPVNHVQYDSE